MELAMEHQVTTPDLAASGIDTTRVEDLKSFDEYSKPLYDVMDSIPNGEKVVLVGHSLGGVSVAKAMEMFHDKIHVAFFVAASLPQISGSVKHSFEQYNKQEMSKNDIMVNKGNFEGENDAKIATSFLFGHKFLASRLYQLCPPEDLMLATTLVRPCPNHLLEGENTSFLTKDNVISQNFQHLMIQNHNVEHMAMLSKPQELCHSLLQIIDNINRSSN